MVTERLNMGLTEGSFEKTRKIRARLMNISMNRWQYGKMHLNMFSAWLNSGNKSFSLHMYRQQNYSKI